MPSHWQPLLVVGVVLLAGCAGVGGSNTAVDADDPTTANQTVATTPEPTAMTTTADAESTADDSSPEYGTEFVSVSKLENQSRHTEWSDEQSVHFENLSESQQAVFRDALDGQVELGPDEENPFGFDDEARPEVVKYEGTWYYVRVAIV